MTTLALWVYIGGLFAFPHRKLGLLVRLLWPMELGQRLAEFALRPRLSEFPLKGGKQ